MPSISDLETHAGLKFTDYQLEALDAALAQLGLAQRLCLYYKTGAGKTYTGLSCMRLWGHDENVLVIAPPSTHAAWEDAGDRLGVQLSCISHAKFRQKNFQLSRTQPVIADEMHLFGGHGGQGWKKLDRLAGALKAPLILASATPNYNDADRVYCIQHVLDPGSCKGGFIEFLYTHCNTKQNPFGIEPLVDDQNPFRNYPDAAAYLAALPHVQYLPDDLVYQIQDVPVKSVLPDELITLGYNRRNHRVIASQMEERHTLTFQTLVDETGRIQDHVYDLVADIMGAATTPVLVYANHSTVAEALGQNLEAAGVDFRIVTGKTSAKDKETWIEEFRSGSLPVLVGTASLATGTDGLDKVCDWLIILDDTDDASLRRQLVGRIMPRGIGSNPAVKHVHRLLRL